MQKRPIRYFLVYVCSLAWDLVVWLIMLLMWLFWGTKLRWEEGVWFEFKHNSWPTRTWYRKKKNGKPVEIPVEQQPILGRWETWGGTSFCHGGFLGPGRSGGKGIDTDTEEHEHIHTEQAETAMMYALIINLAFIAENLLRGYEPVWWFHLVMWGIGWILFYGCSALVAWLRGEDPYRGNINEESAYSQTED